MQSANTLTCAHVWSSEVAPILRRRCYEEAVSHIREATKVLHLDNREIFELIADGSADLMITDKIEVALQSRRHSKLCGLRNEKTFTYQEKGYLIPKEAELLKKVNSWLRKSKANGRLDRTFTRHLKVS